jgi:hypothetical protein
VDEEGEEKLSFSAVLKIVEEEEEEEEKEERGGNGKMCV